MTIRIIKELVEIGLNKVYNSLCWSQSTMLEEWRAAIIVETNDSPLTRLFNKYW